MPSPYSDELVDIGSQAMEQLTLRHQAREQALSVSREVIRLLSQRHSGRTPGPVRRSPPGDLPGDPAPERKQSGSGKRTRKFISLVFWPMPGKSLARLTLPWR